MIATEQDSIALSIAQEIAVQVLMWLHVGYMN